MEVDDDLVSSVLAGQVQTRDVLVRFLLRLRILLLLNSCPRLRTPLLLVLPVFGSGRVGRAVCLRLQALRRDELGNLQLLVIIALCRWRLALIDPVVAVLRGFLAFRPVSFRSVLPELCRNQGGRVCLELRLFQGDLLLHVGLKGRCQVGFRHGRLLAFLASVVVHGG